MMVSQRKTLAAPDSRGREQRCENLLGHYCSNCLDDHLDVVVLMEVVAEVTRFQVCSDGRADWIC